MVSAEPLAIMKNIILIVIVMFMIAGCSASAGSVGVVPTVKHRTIMPTDSAAKPFVEEPAPADDVFSYLKEVALSGFEFGSAPKVAYKWTSDISVSVSGDLAASDQATVKAVIADLSALIAPRKISLVPSGGNITIWYGHDDQFPKRLPGYTEGNRGYFEIRYGNDFSIRHSDILISTEVDGAARAHLVREELTQSLGFFQDSWRQEESIFYQGWTTTPSYSDLDRAIIPLLYDTRVKPGMTSAQVKEALGG